MKTVETEVITFVKGLEMAYELSLPMVHIVDTFKIDALPTKPELKSMLEKSEDLKRKWEIFHGLKRMFENRLKLPLTDVYEREEYEENFDQLYAATLFDIETTIEKKISVTSDPQEFKVLLQSTNKEYLPAAHKRFAKDMVVKMWEKISTYNIDILIWLASNEGRFRESPALTNAVRDEIDVRAERTLKSSDAKDSSLLELVKWDPSYDVCNRIKKKALEKTRNAETASSIALQSNGALRIQAWDKYVDLVGEDRVKLWSVIRLEDFNELGENLKATKVCLYPQSKAAENLLSIGLDIPELLELTGALWKLVKPPIEQLKQGFHVLLPLTDREVTRSVYEHARDRLSKDHTENKQEYYRWLLSASIRRLYELSQSK